MKLVVLILILFPNRVFSTHGKLPPRGEIVSCIQKESPSTVMIMNGDSQYNDYRIGTNMRYDNMYPTVIIAVSNVLDILAGVTCAAFFSMEVIVMNGGHSFEGFSCSNHSLLLHLDDFNNVISFDRFALPTPTVTIESGMRLARLYGVVINQNSMWNTTYVIAGGTCPTVGVSGHALCGGYGLFGREIGLTSDQITEFQVVLANASLIVVNAKENTDLYWALRGSCSTAFGIIVSITLQLHRLTGPDITIIKIPDYYFDSVDNAVGLVEWWQVWGSVHAPLQLSSAVHIHTDYLKFQFVFLGSTEEAIRLTFDALSFGLQNTSYSSNDMLSFYVSGSFLDAVLWWTDDSSITTVEGLMSVTALPPLTARSRTRRKAKSELITQPIERAGLYDLFASIMNKELNQIEIKAYSNPIGAYYLLQNGNLQLYSELYTDSRSPLLRGHLLEMHYGKSYTPASSTVNTTLEDAKLVQGVNAVARRLRKYFPVVVAYPGYIDADLQHPGAGYFGTTNTQTLSQMRANGDPKGILSSRSGCYLYP